MSIASVFGRGPQLGFYILNKTRSLNIILKNTGFLRPRRTYNLQPPVLLKEIIGFRNMTSSSLNSSTSLQDPESSSSGPTKIAIVQMNSTNDKARNLIIGVRRIEEASEQGAKMIFFPEGFDYIANNAKESLSLSESLEGPVMTSYRNLAKKFDVWLSLGGFHERQNVQDDEPKFLSNTHIIIDNSGAIVAKYSKVHLFDVEIPEENLKLQESRYVTGGDKLDPPVQTPIGALGLGICFDVRFPEFSLSLRLQGADILSFPSAFTVPTGQAHWETLLRSRALDNQCYVIAAAQVGKHNELRESFGHSMIVNPWGEIVEKAGTEETIIFADIDLSLVSKIRQRIPAIAGRKPAVYYGLELNSLKKAKFTVPQVFGYSPVPFCKIKLKQEMVFLESAYSRAFVNRKCVLPGHVLVISKRVAPRLGDLTGEEVADMFMLVKMVELVMERIHSAGSSTITIQDGIDAGQTIKHVHVHVIPRKPNDFIGENDEIYKALSAHDKGKVLWRKDGEMIAEATKIREFIIKNFPSEIA